MAVERNPWAVADVVEVRSVPVTIKVVTITGTNEQVRQEVDVQINRVRWTVAVVVGQIDRLCEMNRSETGTAILKLVVPIARLIHATVRRPNVSRRNPDPVFNNRVPVSGPPTITVVLKLPVAWNVKMFFAWPDR